MYRDLARKSIFQTRMHEAVIVTMKLMMLRVYHVCEQSCARDMVEMPVFQNTETHCDD